MPRLNSHDRLNAVTITRLITQFGQVLHDRTQPTKNPPPWFISGIPGVRSKDIHRLNSQRMDIQAIVDRQAAPGQYRLGRRFKILCAPNGKLPG